MLTLPSGQITVVVISQQSFPYPQHTSILLTREPLSIPEEKNEKWNNNQIIGFTMQIEGQSIHVIFRMPLSRTAKRDFPSLEENLVAAKQPYAKVNTQESSIVYTAFLFPRYDFRTLFCTSQLSPKIYPDAHGFYELRRKPPADLEGKMKSFSELDRVRFALQLALAVQALIEKGCFHLDVKLPNVLLKPVGTRLEVKLGDLDAVRRIEEGSLHACSQDMGTEDHLPPECHLSEYNYKKTSRDLLEKRVAYSTALTIFYFAWGNPQGAKSKAGTNQQIQFQKRAEALTDYLSQLSESPRSGLPPILAPLLVTDPGERQTLESAIPHLKKLEAQSRESAAFFGPTEFSRADGDRDFYPPILEAKIEPLTLSCQSSISTRFSMPEDMPSSAPSSPSSHFSQGSARTAVASSEPADSKTPAVSNTTAQLPDPRQNDLAEPTQRGCVAWIFSIFGMQPIATDNAHTPLLHPSSNT